MLKGILLAFIALANWQITDVIDLTDLPNELEESPNASLVLSPDGTMAAWGGRDVLCLYNFVEEAGECAAWPESFRPGFDRYTQLIWSPDSTKLAFTENFFVYFLESDIWVYNVTAGEFNNRTPDDAEGGQLLLSNDAQQIDYAPTWDQEGNLYFFRTKRVDDLRETMLYRLAPDSDTAEVVSDITDTFPYLSVYLPPVISPDGTRMAVIVLGQDFEDGRNGVWVIDLADGAKTRVAARKALWEGFPDWQTRMLARMIPFSLAWAGDGALIVGSLDVANISEIIGQNYHYVDVETLQITPLVDFSEIESAEALSETRDDGHMGIYVMPRLGIVTPDTFFYVHHDTDRDAAKTISAVALPPDGSGPTLVGELEDCDIRGLFGDQRYLMVLTEANRALVYNCAVTLGEDG